jgi:protease-4
VKRRTVVVLVVVAACLIVLCFISAAVVWNLSSEGQSNFVGFGSKVAVIDLSGEIVDSQDFIRQLKKWNDNSSIKAIVIHINSPGGDVAASQEMYREIRKAREKSGKPIIASLASVAASGGYYVACAADTIVANPGTLTGSIGVILSFPTAKKLLDKIGVSWETIKSGELKDVGNFARPMSPEDARMLQAVIDDTYQQFIEAVAEGRNRPKEQIYPLADGSVFTGRQAYNLGLVDTLGSFEDAVSIAGQMAGLGSNPDIIKEKKRSPGFLDVVTGSLNIVEKLSDLRASAPTLLYLYQ